MLEMPGFVLMRPTSLLQVEIQLRNIIRIIKVLGRVEKSPLALQWRFRRVGASQESDDLELSRILANAGGRLENGTGWVRLQFAQPMLRESYTTSLPCCKPLLLPAPENKPEKI